MFDKELYWKRRKHLKLTKTEDGEISAADPAPLRGQGELPNLTRIAKWTEEDHKAGKCTKEQIGRERTSGIKYVMFGGVPYPANRATRRKRVIDRRFTKKGFAFGLRIDSKEYNLIHHIAKRQA